MFDERLLERALARPAQQTAGAALDEVMHLAQSAEYRQAAERAGELLEGGCHDVRALVGYALGVFAERGPVSVPALFAALGALLSALASEGSTDSTLRAADTALRFCFRIIKAHLDFDERQSAAARQAWARHLQSSDAPKVLAACSELFAAIRASLTTAHCESELVNVTTRLEAYFARFPAPVVRPTPPPQPESDESPGEPASPPEEPSAPTASANEPAFARRASDRDSTGPFVEVSPALQQFMRKLQAFELLVESGALAKAAIVADDVRQIVANFDPRIYLPSLLVPHFRLLSSHADQLSVYLEQAATPSWQALEQLYRVDLDSFVEA